MEDAYLALGAILDRLHDVSLDVFDLLCVALDWIVEYEVAVPPVPSRSAPLPRTTTRTHALYDLPLHSIQYLYQVTEHFQRNEGSGARNNVL